MWLQRHSSIKSTHKYLQLSPVEKKEIGEGRTDEPAWTRTARDVQPTVWLLRQRSIPTKYLLVTGSQKSWGWDKPDVCASLSTALGILNYKVLRDFTENCRHPDTKIAFDFLSVRARISDLSWDQDFAKNERERQTAQSETAERKPRQQLGQEQKSWYPADMERCTCHGDFSLKRSSSFSLRSRNKIRSACLLSRQGKVNC